jgi:hypothetical protein
MFKVELRITPSFASLLGSNDYNWFVLEKDVVEGTTVFGLLSDLAQLHPGFGRLIFDSLNGKLSDEILITLNDRLLQGADGSQAILKGGDTVIITPAYEGG